MTDYLKKESLKYKRKEYYILKIRMTKNQTEVLRHQACCTAGSIFSKAIDACKALGITTYAKDCGGYGTASQCMSIHDSSNLDFDVDLKKYKSETNKYPEIKIGYYVGKDRSIRKVKHYQSGKMNVIYYCSDENGNPTSTAGIGCDPKAFIEWAHEFLGGQIP